MKKISGSRFVHSNHCGTLYYSITNLWDFDEHRPQPQWEVVGYCKGRDVQFRAKNSEYAVMLERVKCEDWGGHRDDIGEKVWLHVQYLNKKEFEDYCDNC